MFKVEAMKGIIVSQIRSDRFYDEITHYGYEMKQKSYLEYKAILIGMITCFSYCDGQSMSLTNKKKTSQNNSNNKGKKNIVELDEEVDHGEEDNYEDMVGDYKEKKVKIQNKLNKAQVKPKSQPKKINNQTNENFIENTWRKIWKEFKVISRNFIDITIEIDYYARAEMLRIALWKLNKYIQQKKIRPWIVNFFYLIGCQGILSEVLRKNQKSKYF